MLTMSAAAKRTPTFDELYLEIERLAPGLTGQVLTPGVLTTMSRPGASHDYTLANCEHALKRCWSASALGARSRRNEARGPTRGSVRPTRR
jgi:hypothetical protein